LLKLLDYQDLLFLLFDVVYTVLADVFFEGGPAFV